MYKFCINAFKKFFSLNKSICSNRKLNFRFWYFIIDNCIRLSNNLKYENTILDKWKYKYHVYYLNGNYSNCNYQKKDRSKDIEVLITNYE